MPEPAALTVTPDPVVTLALPADVNAKMPRGPEAVMVGVPLTVIDSGAVPVVSASIPIVPLTFPVSTMLVDPVAELANRPMPPDEEMLPAPMMAMLAPVVVKFMPLNAPVTAIEDDWLISAKNVSAGLLSVAAILRPIAAFEEMV